MCRHHAASCFVKRLDLVGFQLRDDFSDVFAQLLNEHFVLSGLNHHELGLASLANLQECVTCHVLGQKQQRQRDSDWAVKRKIRLAAHTCTPGCFSCMNSNSLLTTVFRNFQCARKKRGYCPTTYMMLDAMTACAHTSEDTSDGGLTNVGAGHFKHQRITLLFFPRLASHKPSKSLITVTRNRFSSCAPNATKTGEVCQG
jgi:hypothetical protein